MEICYFTDGSLNPKISNKYGGIFGYIKTIKEGNRLSVDKVLFARSKPNIHLLESMAIASALQDVLLSDINNKYWIYTDSNYCYDIMKQIATGLEGTTVLPKVYTKNDKSITEKSIINTYNHVDVIAKQNYDVSMIVVKSHCNINNQIKYMRNAYNYSLSIKDAEVICEGNKMIDELVKCYNHLGYINHIPFINPF